MSGDDIYTPNGPAREYAPLAANYFHGCEHGCAYCYVPAVLRIKLGEFVARGAAVRVERIPKIIRAAARLSRDPRPVLLSFTSDPYQPGEARSMVTRRIIDAFRDNEVTYKVLTKGGLRPIRDFDIMADSRCHFGVTIALVNEDARRKWEPGAAPVVDRITALRRAHEMGIKTWVSAEPVIVVDDVLWAMDTCSDFVDVWRVGRLNHQAFAKGIDHRRFLHDAVEVLERRGATYYIKRDLAKADPSIIADTSLRGLRTNMDFDVVEFADWIEKDRDRK